LYEARAFCLIFAGTANNKKSPRYLSAAGKPVPLQEGGDRRIIAQILKYVSHRKYVASKKQQGCIPGEFQLSQGNSFYNDDIR
jgi:hypothetical protein